MGLGMYVLDQGDRQVDFFTDDVDASFMSICQEAPWESLRRGVMQHGTTVFNSLQLRRLVEELRSLPQERTLPVVERVICGAELAIRRSGSLRFMGD